MPDNKIMKGIEIANQTKTVTVSQGGVEIRYQNKPVNYEPTVGFVYLLLDCSGSMEGQKLNRAKDGASKFANEAIAKGYRVGLIQFGSNAIHLCEPQRNLSRLNGLLRDMCIIGSTNMTDAIQLATQKLSDKGKGAFRSICIATDGMPDNSQTTLDAAQKAKKIGIDIITVGTDDADQDFLKKIASRSELGIKVSQDQFEKTIASTAKMLPLPPSKKGI